MKLIVTGTSSDLAKQINNFSKKYHNDYFETNSHAKRYLLSEPSEKNSHQLAVSLYSTLNSWGAGRRAAPSAKPVEAMTTALLSTEMHRKLVELSKCFEYLTIENGQRALKNDSPYDSVGLFDEKLISTLNDISDFFLIGNTNVTYPMKLLLLITGLMPALDSQVKGGLAIAGVKGINTTRFLLPKTVASSSAKKICCLPFYISDCVLRYSDLLENAVNASFYKELSVEYGRIFDVLFFMQSSLTNSERIISLELSSSSKYWYEI